jgi:hypothetical protein
VELFRALAQPPTKSVSGLWAELFIIRNARDAGALVRAWHASPEERYDFVSAAQRIEIKASAGRERVHHFSLAQLTPPAGCHVIIGSMFVERVGSGTSLGDLIDEVRGLVAGDVELQQRIDTVVASTLGNALRLSLSERFDREQALDSISFFSEDSVPKIAVPVPSGVSDVHFRADLGQSEPITPELLSQKGGIFAAAVPG